MASATEATSTVRKPSVRGSLTDCAISQNATGTAAAIPNHDLNFITASRSFPVMMTGRNRAGKYIRVHKHNQPDQHHQSDAVLQDRAEQLAFLANLARYRASNYQRLGRNHLPNHTPAAL